MEVLAQDIAGVDQNEQFSGYFGRKPSNLAAGKKFKPKARPVAQMHEFPNMSAYAILDRRAEVRKDNLSRSRYALNAIAKQKEKQQYDSYISNVNTLNQMKKIFSDFH